MRKIRVFNFLTLDGYFEGPGHDIGWHRHDAEQNEFAAQSLGLGGVLLFGRRTYELMAGYWPSPQAMQNDPTVARAMNAAEKIVFSKTLHDVEWNNTRLCQQNIIEEMRALKRTPGKDMTVLGSGSVVAQFAEEGLIDEYRIMVDPVLLGEGTSFCKGIRRRCDLQLTSTRTFEDGSVLLCYRPC